MATYIRYSFAVDGDRVAVADSTQPSGIISLQSGYGFDYERNIETDPLAKNIERNKFNQIMFLVTDAIRQYQQNGTPDFIPSSENDGAPYSYSKYARVLKSGIAYESLIDANTNTPPHSTWRVVSSDATTDLAGLVEKALLAELIAGTANKFPDSAALLDGFDVDANGITFPSWLNGLTIKWGYYNMSTPTEGVTFPTAFANTCYGVFASGDQADGGVNNDLVNVSIEAVTASGFTANGWGVANNGSGNTGIAPHFWYVAFGR